MMKDPQVELCFSTIKTLHDRIASREVSPIEVTEAILNRIDLHNREMRAYITVVHDIAMAQAEQAEREIRTGRLRGPLHGIPVGLKDNIETRGIRTSCGSLVNPDWIPDTDAGVYARLRAAGAVLVGKTNLFEYAFSMNDAFPQPLNPWHAGKTSSGSSSGSAVSVAVGMAHGSIGTDTGGSGRAPANVNGVVGFKPTYGRVSRAGIVPLSYSLDHASVFTRSVIDAGYMLQPISGFDQNDESSSQHVVPDMLGKIGRNLSGIRVGVATGYTVSSVDPDVDGAIKKAINVLVDLGVDAEEVTLPLVEHAEAMQQSIMLPEVAAVHFDTLRETPEKFGETALMRLDLGSVIPATAYIQAQQVRVKLRDAFESMFDTFDVVVGPANPARAGDAGSWYTNIDGRVLDLRQTGPEYTGIYNLAGVPAIVVPAGFSSDGTPIGFQIAGRWFDEPTVIQVAHAFEGATSWHTMRPPLPGD